jgi:hypothetical protein
MTHRGRNNHKVFPKIFMRILQSTAVQRYRVLDNLSPLFECLGRSNISSMTYPASHNKTISSDE